MNYGNDEFFSLSSDQAKLALQSMEHWENLYHEQKAKLKNAEDFIKLLMQQLEQARAERDRVTIEYANTLEELHEKHPDLIEKVEVHPH